MYVYIELNVVKTFGQKVASYMTWMMLYINFVLQKLHHI